MAQFVSEQAIAAVLSCVFLLACLVASPAALAQTYPDRNVTIVVTSAPGALTDTLTRAIAQRLSEMRDRGEPGRRRIHDRDPVRDAGRA
jgi:hypothetical protein